MEFRQLRTFRAVADQLSFSKAAEQLYMAQSSVSAQIRLLEEDLDVKLFDRIGRRVLITDAGLKLYEYARHFLNATGIFIKLLPRISNENTTADSIKQL